MKETVFYILLNLKTPKGFERLGKFYVGNDKRSVYALFHRLKGTSEVNEKNVLYMELMETRDKLPFNMQILTCTLEEVSENCRIITKEMFRQYNLAK